MDLNALYNYCIILYTSNNNNNSNNNNSNNNNMSLLKSKEQTRRAQNTSKYGTTPAVLHTKMYNKLYI